MFKNFSDFLNEDYYGNSLSAKEITNYITDITPDESDVPDYFLHQIEKSNKRFELRRVKIEDLLKADPSLKEYVESKEERYGEDSDSEHEPDIDDLNYPIVVFQGEVVDGYSRTSFHYHAGEEHIEAYVSN